MPDDLRPEDVCNGGIYAIRRTLTKVKWALRSELARALSVTYSPKRKKEALRVDEDAEFNFIYYLTGGVNTGLSDLFKDINVAGEESIIERDNFTGREGVYALADMIDGTDLLERNLSNWCSAVVFFCPRRKEGNRIVAACVGVPSGKIYFAHEDRPGAFFKLPDEQTRPVGGRSTIKKLNQASLCFYGQKVSRLKQISDLPLLDHLATQPKPKNKHVKKNRIYTLAGIPMMMKLIDRQDSDAANIDVVFDCFGQMPHDVVAGAYIARKQGATIINLDTQKEMTNAELERGLLRPGHEESKLRYVIASTRSLANELVPLLRREGVKSFV